MIEGLSHLTFIVGDLPQYRDRLSSLGLKLCVQTDDRRNRRSIAKSPPRSRADTGMFSDRLARYAQVHEAAA